MHEPLLEKYQVYNQEFSESIPPLYHYTSTAGLLGMLSYKQLWFTQLNFSNDVVESTYAIDLISKVMREYIGLNNYSAFSPDLNEDKYFSQLDVPLVFTFSLSENGDTLSQWRGYCPAGGYSIRFSSEQVDAMMKRNNLTIGKCIYDEAEQKQFIKDCIICYPTIEEYEAEKKSLVPLLPNGLVTLKD